MKRPPCQIISIGSDGGTVRALLLPGLRNAGGKVLHKALVRLG